MAFAMISNFGNWFTSEWLLALILTLFLVDLIWYARPLGLFAAFLTTFWICMRFGPWGKWTVFFAILIFLIVYSAYFSIYVPFAKWIAKLFTKSAPKETVERIIGEKGRIRIVSGKSMFKWDDELWPIKGEQNSFSEGEIVKCIDFTDGFAVVERVQP